MLKYWEKYKITTRGSILIFLVGVLLRWCISLHSYSGKQTPPMYGDYEAQRHWMEITLHLPIEQWYFSSPSNNLLYWGLDYPPLTAYVSYIFGFLGSFMEPEFVALETSHGYESASSKVFMRLSVILMDILIYIPSIYVFAYVWYPSSQWLRQHQFIIAVILQPALLLIDHGHFQYNGVCLGLTVLGIVFIFKDHEVIGSICFCGAMSFKQMALYYVPAFTCYLLARCIYRPRFWLHLLKLGSTVIGTFVVLWSPLCIWNTTSTLACQDIIVQVLHRIFPFSRGLFEDKVANFWCVLDLFIKVRNQFSQSMLVKLCLLSTIAGFTIPMIDLLRRPPSRVRFLLALLNCSLSFFLFSYQVHEKSILIPLLPATLLMTEQPLLMSWFVEVATFSMFHLLKKDGLVVPYAVCMIAFCAFQLYPSISKPIPDDSANTPAIKIFTMLSLIGMAVLHALEVVWEPPKRYPHIHLYFFAIYSFAHFGALLLYSTYVQWTYGANFSKIKTK